MTAAPIHNDPHLQRRPACTGDPETAIEEGTANRYAYNAACMYAVAAAVILDTAKSPDAAKYAQAESDQAMKVLTIAVTNGFCDLARLKSDKQLDVLRDRDDFQALIAKLESKTKK